MVHPSLASLLNPKGIAVVGASQRLTRASRALISIQKFGFAGEIVAVNPNYDEVQGTRCYRSVEALPPNIDCLVIAVGADAACETLERAFVHGIRAAVVLSSGFGEGGTGKDRADRLRALGAKGMSICGPNCYGVFNALTNAAAFSGALPDPILKGRVALVSQSGGLSTMVYAPLMDDRQVGFSHIVSCGNQLATTVEDYTEYFVDDPDVSVVVVVFECLLEPRRLLEIGRRAREKKKTLIFFQTGRSPLGQVMVQSHTGALVSSAVVTETFLRRCGIIQPLSFDELVETAAMMAVVPADEEIDGEVIVLTGSGGGSAIIADQLHAIGMPLAPLHEATQAKIREILPEFGSVTNPLDATGAMYDDPTVLPRLLTVLLDQPGRPIITSAVALKDPKGAAVKHPVDLAEAARSAAGRTIVSFTFSPLGGPYKSDIVSMLRDAHIPALAGAENGLRALRHLPTRRDYWKRRDAGSYDLTRHAPGGEWDFLPARKALLAEGVAIVDARLAGSRDEAVAAFRELGRPVAVKAEVLGLLHKSDIGGVRLNCATPEAVAEAYDDVVAKARAAGFSDTRHVLMQPMEAGVAELFAGIVNDPLFGPTVTIGLGGIFIEILKDVATEMAPLERDDALAMIRRLKGAAILEGARGRPAGDIDALADFLVKLGRFAAANYGRFKSLDLNPVIVKPKGQGVVAVDIAVETA